MSFWQREEMTPQELNKIFIGQKKGKKMLAQTRNSPLKGRK